MAHKVHPKIFRIRGMDDWDSRGFYKNHSPLLEEDFKIREFLTKKFSKVGIEKIEIERFVGKINIIVTSARPGLIIGRGGEGIEVLRKELDKIVSDKKTPAWQSFRQTAEKVIAFDGKEKKSTKNKISLKNEENAKKEIKIEVREVKNPWTSASLTSQWIAQQLEKRFPFRKALKQAIAKVIVNKEVQGVKIEVSGRLNGAEIARREWMKNGRLPLQTIRAIIDYAKAEAHCTYGVIGIKVWMYKGERFD